MQIFSDLIWAFRMLRARRARRRLLFLARHRFDDALCPRIDVPRSGGKQDIIAYPDAVYHARREDFARAFTAIPANINRRFPLPSKQPQK